MHHGHPLPNGQQRMQSYTVARTFYACLLDTSSRFAAQVVAELGTDRAFLRRVIRLSGWDARRVLRIVQAAQLRQRPPPGADHT